MQTALQKAIALILSADRELMNILGTTARMTLMSSLLALLIGVPLGILLHSFVISQIKVDMVSFKTIIFGRSFAFAIVIVIGFSLVVDLLMRRKLDRIDMAESMKAVE